MTDLPNGPTVRVHVEWAMKEVEETAQIAFTQIRRSRRIRPAARQQLWRDLAGVVSAVEGIRLWLDKGAPE